MNHKDAYIRKLETENDQLRRLYGAVNREKDKTTKAYQHLVKQIKQIKKREQSTPCRFCQQLSSLTTISSSSEPILSDSDGSPAFTPLSSYLASKDTLPSPTSTLDQLALCPKQSTDFDRHRGDQRVQSPLAHGNAQGVPGEPGQGKRRSSSTMSSDVSMRSSSELVEGDDIAADTEPDEQSSASSSDSPSVGTDEDYDDDSATSIYTRKGTESVCAGREGPETPDAQQRGDLRHSSIPRNNGELSDKVSLTLHHRKERAYPTQAISKTKARRATPNGAKPSTKTNAAAGPAGPRKACSNSRSNSASGISSASRTLESRMSHNATALGNQNSTTVVSGPRIQPATVTPTISAPAAATQRCDQPANRGQEELDADLKAAIRESYARFGLDGQRLTFCCEPLTLDPTAINLNTNWKQRSKLDRSLVERLLQMGSEISAFLPESDIERASQKEIELMRRLCTCKRPITASRSLKDVVGSLRRERDVTKDELNLIEFDLYSTLIVMRCQSESQAGPSFPDFQ